MGRYTLSVETFKKQKIVIEFDGPKGYTAKVPLSVIDEFTTQASNARELTEILEIKGVKNIKITYVHNREEKTLPIAYDDKHSLNEVVMIDDSNVSQTNKVFLNEMFNFLKLLENKEFYEMIMKSREVTDKQKEYIFKRIKEGDYSDFVTRKIYEYSASYKQFRSILFLAEQFKTRDQKIPFEQSRDYLEPEEIEPAPVVDEDNDEDEYDPDKDGFMSDEEMEAYQNYLKSLPDDNFTKEERETKKH